MEAVGEVVGGGHTAEKGFFVLEVARMYQYVCLVQVGVVVWVKLTLLRIPSP